MKVEINTKDTTVYVSANDSADSLAAIDKWIAALRISRRWLRRELEKKNAPRERVSKAQQVSTPEQTK